MKIQNPGLALAFGSTLTYCTLNVAVRLQLESTLTIWGLLSLRGIFGLAVLGLAARIFRKNLLGRNRNLLLAVGFSSFMSTVCVTLAIREIPLYQALVMLYLYPALTVPLNFFINSAKVRPKDILLVLLAFVGCLFLIWPDSAVGLYVGIYHLVGFGGALAFALSLVLATRLGDDNCGLEPIFYYSFWALFGTLLMSLAFGEPIGLDSSRAVISGLGLAALAIAAILMAYAALRWLAPFKVGVVGTLEVFGGALASWLVFDDPITVRAVIGGLIILGVALKLRQS